MSYLLRARLKRSASIASIATHLLPEDPSRRAEAAHRLLWSLFAGDPDAPRPFLWREEKSGVFYILTSQLPGESEIFDVEVKEFAPALAAGDRLQFSLRANATRAYKQPGAARGKRADVVMAALSPLTKPERSAQREAVIQEAGAAWLAGQGGKHGFLLPAPPCVDGYNKWKIPRGNAAKIEISTLDFDGILEVAAVDKFTAALANGFGHAKAFGCGLMLIRRA
ncbi:type I-E CRISPR-associated protein Cas6/Cse3/CasE [Acidocella sp.]|uniref:type I-E CRISPR-associated protein Cas6/Cse3/CasE n=1 Tax=Acidocella sp. TaxID=50710 RepID=UPI001834586E|nr:type I-E CRISPR-associated protein Cas6/Cse3/CasE [Acidocella sp.]NNM57544.1 type I-E CRISPR-associated protein Cas6/Cse3/CasE [Acidocella sp.]